MGIGSPRGGVVARECGKVVTLSPIPSVCLSVMPVDWSVRPTSCRVSDSDSAQRDRHEAQRDAADSLPPDRTSWLGMVAY